MRAVTEEAEAPRLVWLTAEAVSGDVAIVITYCCIETRGHDNNDRIEKRSLIFCTVSPLRRGLSPTRTLKWIGSNRVQITCNTSGAYHVQHVVCRVVRRDSSAVLSDRIKIAFIISFILLAETINR